MTEILDHTTKTFKFSYPTCTSEEVVFRLEAPVRVPPAGGAAGARELVQRLRAMFHVPVYLEDELNEKLAQFLSEETKRFHDERDAALLGRLKEGEGAEAAVRAHERRLKEHVAEFAEHKGSSEEEEFAGMYHKLVHSPALESVLRAEAALAGAARAAAAARDKDIADLTQRQTEEMEEKMRLLHTETTEDDINALAARQFAEQGAAAARWRSELDALRASQRAEHRAALTAALRRAEPPPLSPLSPLPAPTSSAARPEESFTIHLGSQLKQTHNIRIVAADVEDLFEPLWYVLRLGWTTAGVSRRQESSTVHLGSQLERTHNIRIDLFDPLCASASSRQLQTALALYSGELSGAVVLREGGSGGRRGGALEAARAAADHHFADLDTQMQTIEELTREPIEKRNAARYERSVADSASVGATSVGANSRRRRHAQTGDVLLTRHSNLPDAHVVFHLVINDDDVKNGEMTSRHPAILGLRSVLQCASCNDVTSLALPLLLRHELSEEMTAAWCARRAELVLKCAKGFMLEAAAGGGALLRTLTLCAPAQLAPPVFAALTALLPAVFRLSTPLKIKPKV